MARSLSGSLFKAARTARTIEMVAQGRAPQRAKNIVVGRALNRAGVWRRLWGRW